MTIDLAPSFPLEFIVPGTPVSIQSRRPSAKGEWKDRVRTASKAALSDGYWASEAPISVTLFYFPATRMQGDVDNIVKLTLDALSRHVYTDDAQVERLVVQKFEPGNIFSFRLPTATLAEALSQPKPLLYVRLSDQPFEDLR